MHTHWHWTVDSCLMDFCETTETILLQENMVRCCCCCCCCSWRCLIGFTRCSAACVAARGAEARHADERFQLRKACAIPDTYVRDNGIPLFRQTAIASKMIKFCGGSTRSIITRRRTTRFRVVPRPRVKGSFDLTGPTGLSAFPRMEKSRGNVRSVGPTIPWDSYCDNQLSQRRRDDNVTSGNWRLSVEKAIFFFSLAQAEDFDDNSEIAPRTCGGSCYVCRTYRVSPLKTRVPGVNDLRLVRRWRIIR